MDEELRISDAEREQAAAELGEHYVRGRLTTEEHAERLDRIWAARTRGELGQVFIDLPGRFGPAAVRAAHGVGGPASWAPGPPFRGWAPLLLLLGVLGVITVVTHVPVVLLGVLAVLVVGARRRRWAQRQRALGSTGPEA